jgi:cytochrome c5
MRRARRVAVVGSLAVVAGCTHALPDADSAGARLYQARCGTCHALHEPRALTAAMWEVQVDRMRETMRRRGVAPLTVEEQALLLEYLRAHATDAGAPAAR